MGWGDYLRYVKAYFWLERTPVSRIEEENQNYWHHCEVCDRTFPNRHVRDVHRWQDHPGCPEYHITSFWKWLRSGAGAYTSTHCPEGACRRTCGGSPFRR